MFLPFFSYALPSGSLIKSVGSKTFYAGKGGDLTLPLNRNAEGISVALMPGAPYVSDALSLTNNPENVAPADSGIYVSGGDGKLLFFHDPYASLENRSLVFSGERAGTLFAFGDSLYFSQNKLLKKAIRDGKNGVVVSDVFDAGKRITSLYISANLIYLLIEKRELVVLDLDYGKQGGEGRYAFSADINKLIVRNGICYLTSTTEGLIVVDATNPKKIAGKGGYKTTGPALDFGIAGGYAYIADGWTGVTVLNISDPLNVFWEAGLNNLGYVEKIEIGGAYVAAKNTLGTITFIDAANPERPEPREKINFKKNISDYAIWNEALFVLEGESLKKIIFKNIKTPEYVNDGVNLGGSRRAFIHDGAAYVADWFSGLHIYDISNPIKPGFLSAFHTPGSPKGVLVDGDIAFVGDDDHGLQVINISDPLNPFLVSNLRMPGLAYTMRLRGQYLYIAMHRGGFHIVDISDLKNPKIAGSYDTPGKSWSLEFSGDNLFVADDSSGVLVFDVKDPEHIRKIGEFNPGGFAEDILIKDNLAYVVFFDNGLFVVDISDPKNPVELSHLKTPGSARGIDIQGDYAYIADWFAGFHIVDISIPEKPRVVSSYDTDGGAWGITRRGKYVFLMDWWGGLKVFDVSDIKNPKSVGGYHKRGRVNDIKVNGNYSYIANGAGGLQVYDLKNPLFPVWITGVDLPGTAVSLDLERDFAYIALGSGGVSVLNIKDPFHPLIVTTERTPGATEKVEVSRGFLYVSDDRAGLIIYKIKDSGELKQVAAYKGGVTDFSVSWDGVYLVVDGKEIVWAEPSGNFQFRKVSFKGEGAGAPGLIRIFGKKACVSEKEGGIHIFKIETGTFIHQEVVPVSDRVLDIKITSERLLVLGENTGLMEFDMPDGKMPSLKGVYKPVRRMTRIETTKSFAFLSGEKVITSLKYLPRLSGQQLKDKSVMLKVPVTLPVGNYSLVVTAEGEIEILQDAVKVVHERLTPKFTLDDFKKVLEEMKAKHLKEKIKLKREE